MYKTILELLFKTIIISVTTISMVFLFVKVSSASQVDIPLQCSSFPAIGPVFLSRGTEYSVFTTGYPPQTVVSYTAPDDGEYMFLTAYKDMHVYNYTCGLPSTMIDYWYHCIDSPLPASEIPIDDTYVWRYTRDISGSWSAASNTVSCWEITLSMNFFVYEKTQKNTCEVSVSVSSSEVWPVLPVNQWPFGYNGNRDTTSEVRLSWSKQTPPDGCTVNLTVEPVDYSGGHDHDGNRPRGTLNGQNTITVFIPGNTTAGSISAGFYKSSEVSGEEKIVATVNGEKKGEVMVKIRVPGLKPLESSTVYNLTGAPPGSFHLSNHFGLRKTNNKVYEIAFDYVYNYDAILGINDMSLSMGGGFDIFGNWLADITSPQCTQKGHGHCGHRTGTSVDIDRCAQSINNPNITDLFCKSLGYPPGFVKVPRNTIRELCSQKNGYLKREATIHCEIPCKEADCYEDK